MDIIIKIKKRIRLTLLVCICISLLFLIAGVVLLILNNQSQNNILSTYNLNEILLGLLNLNPYSYMIVGIFLLILTPVLRVITTIIQFAKEKDKFYAAIATVVLFIITLSFIFGLFIR